MRLLLELLLNRRSKYLTNSGLDLGDGILVAEYLRTSYPDVFGAGDVANYQDVLFGNAGASNTGTMPYPRDSTAPDHSWEIEARLSMCRISFLTFSISHMSIGAMRPVPTRWYSAEICRATVSAYGGCVSSGW